MLIESEVQTRATRNQRRAIRETADAASRAVHDQEAAARQLAAQQARTAARTAEAAKQPKREQYLAANDDRTAWAQRFRSILTATQPVAELAPKTARPTSDPAVVNAIIEQYNPVGPAAIEATDVMIEQAGKPQTLASPGKKLGLPGQAMPGQAELQALALQSWREAERVTLAANAPDYEAVHNAMISQALYSPTLAPFAELSPSVVQGAYPPPMAQSLLAALAARNDSEDRNAAPGSRTSIATGSGTSSFPPRARPRNQGRMGRRAANELGAAACSHPARCSGARGCAANTGWSRPRINSALDHCGRGARFVERQDDNPRPNGRNRWPPTIRPPGDHRAKSSAIGGRRATRHSGASARGRNADARSPGSGHGGARLFQRLNRCGESSNQPVARPVAPLVRVSIPIAWPVRWRCSRRDWSGSPARAGYRRSELAGSR